MLEICQIVLKLFHYSSTKNFAIPLHACGYSSNVEYLVIERGSKNILFQHGKLLQQQKCITIFRLCIFTLRLCKNQARKDIQGMGPVCITRCWERRRLILLSKFRWTGTTGNARGVRLRCRAAFSAPPRSLSPSQSCGRLPSCGRNSILYTDWSLPLSGCPARAKTRHRQQSRDQ